MPKYKSHAYTLKKRGDSWQFNIRAFDPKKGKVVRIRQQYTTEDDARKAVELIIDRAEAGASPKPTTPKEFSQPSLRRVFDMLWADEWKTLRSARTAKCNAEDCLRILGEDTPVDQVTTESIDHLIRSLKDEELTGGTIRRKLAALSRILTYAAERAWINAVPVIRRKAAGKERARNRYIRDDEEMALMKYLKDFGYCPDFFAFLIDTGLRLSEAIKLEWHEVDGEWIRVPENKADYPRSIPATGRVQDILARRKDARQPGDKYVWQPEITVNRAQWQWEQARRSMGLLEDADFVIHVCRHTFASRLAMAGVPLHTIKELGGWKTLAMVMRYAHLCPDAKLAGIKQMEQRRLKIG